MIVCIVKSTVKLEVRDQEGKWPLKQPTRRIAQIYLASEVYAEVNGTEIGSRNFIPITTPHAPALPQCAFSLSAPKY